MEQTVNIKRRRYPKSQLEQIYDPNLRNSIEDFYKALDVFMRDVDEEDQENDTF